MPDNDYHLQPTKVDIPDDLLHAQSVQWDKDHKGVMSDTRGHVDEAPAAGASSNATSPPRA